MAEEKEHLSAADIGVSIDPATWKEPVQTFPGIIEASEYRWASDDYKKETEFRPRIDEQLPQWHLVVVRMDAVLITSDGEEVPARRYGGIDLRKYSKAEGGLVDINPRHAKEHFIMTEWKKVALEIEPPDPLVGRKFIFNYWQTKAFGRNVGRNVLVPVQVLSPDYEYDGEIQRIQLPPRENVEEGEVTAGTTPPTEDTLEAALIEALKGKTKDDHQEILSSLPEWARTTSIVTGVATGSLIDKLVEEGKVSVSGDGKFA